MTSFSATRIFILSPAHAGGVRARLLLNPRAAFPLARQFHTEGLPIATVFAFASGLYFRGKIAYARHFAGRHPGNGIKIITPNAGLVDPDVVIGPAELAALGETDIEVTDPRYFKPLRRDALELAARLDPSGQVVLFGSIATPKYREVLLEVFSERLLFPADFVGRGDMSRGALLLRAVKEDRELDYVVVKNALLTGRRAPPVGRGRTK